MTRFAVDAFLTPEGVQHVPDARTGPLMLVEPDPTGQHAWRRRFAYGRPLRWHEPLFARVVVSRCVVDPGSVLPPWYYALGYLDLMRDQAVFFFLPVAIVVRALRWAEFIWNRARCRPSWFDKQLMDRGRR